MQETMRNQIRGFLEARFPAAKSAKDSDLLLSNGVLDSLGILDVVAFLEREFKIPVVDEDLTPQNFESVRAMLDFVKSKSGIVAE